MIIWVYGVSKMNRWCGGCGVGWSERGVECEGVRSYPCLFLQLAGMKPGSASPEPEI